MYFLSNIVLPEKWQFHDLYGGGRIYFGLSSFKNGMQRVGDPPILAKFEGVQNMPEDVFVISSYKSIHLLKLLMEKTRGFIPDVIRADCFEFLWREQDAKQKYGVK